MTWHNDNTSTETVRPDEEASDTDDNKKSGPKKRTQEMRQPAVWQCRSPEIDVWRHWRCHAKLRVKRRIQNDNLER